MTGGSQAARFSVDLEAKPASLEVLARDLADPGLLADVPRRPRRVLLLGMGSSAYAAGVAALRLRAAGIDAVAELASVETSYPPGPDMLVVAVSASGGSEETLAAIEPHAGRSRIVAITNVAGSPITGRADVVVTWPAARSSTRAWSCGRCTTT